MRYEAYNNDLFDVLNKKVGKKEYNILINHLKSKGSSTLYDMQRLFTDEQIRNLLNTVSDKTEPGADPFEIKDEFGGESLIYPGERGMAGAFVVLPPY